MVRRGAYGSVSAVSVVATPFTPVVTIRFHEVDRWIET